jgi:PAS domain S-box-containing protein
MTVISSTFQLWQRIVAGPVPHDRLVVFRRMCLIVAVLTLGGVTLAMGYVPPLIARERFQTAFCTFALISLWTYGFRRGAMPSVWLPFEAALLVLSIQAIANPVAALGITYVGIQYRALFGTRRDAWLLAAAYMSAFLVGLRFVPNGYGPLTIVECMALGACVIVLHTLLEVLTRDQERSLALRESEQRFRSVAENLREALLITDTSDTIILANARVRELFGYEPQELVGKKATELLLPEAKADWPDRMRRRLSGLSELYETELVRKDGTRVFVEVSATPYRDALGNVTGSLGAISDVSERKHLEERLRQGMRMEAVGQLAGGVAHDFNNLLTVIKCNTEMLLGDLNPSDPARANVGEIARSADRGATMTQQLLAFGRKQFLQPRRITLPDVVTGAATMLRRLAGRDVMLVTVHDDTKHQVFADPLQLEHVLVTLVRNAKEAMPNGGRITIETGGVAVTEERPRTATQEMPTGRYAMLSVVDTGVGMPLEVMNRLFEPFVTTKDVGEGSGLGLASMYGIVRQSGGYVDIESAPNAGTTVRIYLPLAESPNSTATVPELQTA